MTLIQVRRGAAATWTSANPVLSSGEPGFETDTGREKIGDGTSAWTSLPYKPGPTEAVNTVASSGSTLTLPDPSIKSISLVTLTASCTLTFPTATAGKSFTLVLVQGGTGSYVVTWPGFVKWTSAVAPTLSTVVGKIDYLAFVCVDGSTWSGFLTGRDVR
jgi:hypothetical protein